MSESTRRKTSSLKKRSESTEQKAVVSWFRAQYPRYRLIAIPNGQWVAGAGKRKFALINKYKAEGMTLGVSDLFLCVARKGYHGMFIEMKIKGSKITDQQIQWQRDMLHIGYESVIVYGFEDAKAKIEDYLKV